MANFTLQILEEILERRDLDALKGHFENQWFECKRQLYDFNQQRQKAEFAKDVCSLANLDGGIILLGVKAEKKQDEVPFISDVVTSIHPIRADLIDIDKHLKILNEWMFPQVEGLEIKWLDLIDGSGVIIAIKIPKQKETLKPFLHFFVNDNDKKDSIFFGYSIRSSGDSAKTKIETVYSLLQRGLNYHEELASRLDGLNARFDELARSSYGNNENADKQENAKQIVDERLKKNLLELGITGNRILALSGFTDVSNPPTTFSDLEGIQNMFENATSGLRESGWTILYSPRLELNKPSTIRTEWKDLRSLQLFADGTTISVFDFEYICFLRDETVPRIIPIALVEVVFQFVTFFFEYLKKLSLNDINVFLRVDLINMHKGDTPTMLQPYTAMPNTFSEPQKAPVNDFSQTVEITTFDARRAAVEVLELIYNFFGLDETQIPYTIIDQEKRLMDLTPFK